MIIRVAVLTVVLAAPAAAAPLGVSGFALLRTASHTGSPFEDQPVSSQIQVGLDWRPSVTLSGHVHLLARDDPQGSQRGSAGVVQAYVDKSFVRDENRLRVMAGAFFLPTSRENVDALWESPYTITPSALNSWFGEEFRPIGVDVSYTARRAFTIGGTVFRGNDTFGAIIVDRGWALRDHWSLLGEHVPSSPEYRTSVSGEIDGKLGWSARARWNNDHATIQATHVDNRADLEARGDLLTWDTTFDMLGFDYSWKGWTFAGETMWGVTAVLDQGFFFAPDIGASYLLISRRVRDFRFTVRGEEFRSVEDGSALAATVFWSPRGRVRTGVEVLSSGGREKVSLEVRYSFSGS